MEIISSITEAYSMQPATFHVINKNLKNDSLAEIRLEKDKHDASPVYVGYTTNGEKLFMYRADSVNVHYKPKGI